MMIVVYQLLYIYRICSNKITVKLILFLLLPLWIVMIQLQLCHIMNMTLYDVEKIEWSF